MDIITRHRNERAQIASRLYMLDDERERLRNRYTELGGIIAALESLSAKAPEPTPKPAAPEPPQAGPAEPEPAE